MGLGGIPPRRLLLAILVGGCSRLNPAYEGESSTTGTTGGSTRTTAESTVTDSTPTGEGTGDETRGNDDPCATDNGGCPPDAICTPADRGDVECSCLPGWIEDGAECIPALPPLRVEMRCTMGQGCFGPNVCNMGSAEMQLVFSPPQPATYDVTLRVRGVAEPAPYEGGQDGPFHNVDGAPIDPVLNTFILFIDDPPVVVNLNSDPMPPPPEQLACVGWEYEFTIPMDADTPVTLLGNSLDDCGLDNEADVMAPGIDHQPNAQYMQVDFVSATPQ